MYTWNVPPVPPFQVSKYATEETRVITIRAGGGINNNGNNNNQNNVYGALKTIVRVHPIHLLHSDQRRAAADLGRWSIWVDYMCPYPLST